MNFLTFKDFSRIFLNSSKFISDFFGFVKSKKIKFLSLADVEAEVVAK